MLEDIYHFIQLGCLVTGLTAVAWFVASGPLYHFGYYTPKMIDTQPHEPLQASLPRLLAVASEAMWQILIRVSGAVLVGVTALATIGYLAHGILTLL